MDLWFLKGRKIRPEMDPRFLSFGSQMKEKSAQTTPSRKVIAYGRKTGPEIDPKLHLGCSN